MSDYCGFVDKNYKMFTVSVLIKALLKLQEQGFGSYGVTVRGEYALDDRYIIGKSWCDDNPTIDFYGQA